MERDVTLELAKGQADLMVIHLYAQLPHRFCA
jgi:hypothetical protein